MGWNEGDQLHLGQPQILKPEVPHPRKLLGPIQNGMVE